MTAPYMPFYIADFQADTVHLNGFETGAYLMLLMAMWRSGGSLDASDKRLARYAKLTPQQWERVRDTVLELFVPDADDPGKITHHRLRDQIATYHAAVRKKQERGSKGGKAKALKSLESGLPEAETGRACEVPDPANQNQNQNQNQTGEDVSNETPSPESARDGFANFARAYPRPGGRAGGGGKRLGRGPGGRGDGGRGQGRAGRLA